MDQPKCPKCGTNDGVTKGPLGLALILCPVCCPDPPATGHEAQPLLPTMPKDLELRKCVDCQEAKAAYPNEEIFVHIGQWTCLCCHDVVCSDCKPNHEDGCDRYEPYPARRP